MISSKNITFIAVLLTALVLIFTVVVMLAPNSVITGNLIGSIDYGSGHLISYSDDDYYSDYSKGAIAKINLAVGTATTDSKNVSVVGNTITVLGGGTYVISGELTDGSIIVDSSDGAVVRLVLNGAKINSSDFSAIYIKQSEKTVISTVKGTENYLTDAEIYDENKLADGKPDAALYSKDDLTINGAGTLFVIGNYEDAIKVNDSLKITEGTLKVTAKDEGISVNDAIGILNADLEITSGNDALRCESDTQDKGFIALEGARLTAKSEGDGISSSSAIYANNAALNITAGGGSENAQKTTMGFGGGRGFGGAFKNQNSVDAASTKAIKAGTKISINGGEYILDSSDDAIHSDGDIDIRSGTITISCGDDAIHAEKNATLNPETLTISECTEGIEGAYITINGGIISITSSDDGINAVGENSMGGGFAPMGMHKENITDEDIYLTINGGNISINTDGDGVDSNGAALINGGNIVVYGPENNGNSSLDFQYGFIINGGSLLAAGSSGMAETPSESSAQNALVFYLDESFNNGSEIKLTDDNGNEILSGTSEKKFNWVCVSSENIVKGEKYTLLINGSEINTLEVTDNITSSGSKGRGMW